MSQFANSCLRLRSKSIQYFLAEFILPEYNGFGRGAYQQWKCYSTPTTQPGGSMSLL